MRPFIHCHVNTATLSANANANTLSVCDGTSTMACLQLTSTLSSAPLPANHTRSPRPGAPDIALPTTRHNVFQLLTHTCLSSSHTLPSFTTHKVIGCCGPCVANDTEIAKLKLPDLPASFDWRAHKTASGLPVVTPIVNQGKCGSCWAFSSVAAIETAWLLAGHPPVGGVGALSVQRVLDCVYPMMRGGEYPHAAPNCSGGGLVQEGLE